MMVVFIVGRFRHVIESADNSQQSLGSAQGLVARLP
jgi:hypothetical protein